MASASLQPSHAPKAPQDFNIDRNLDTVLGALRRLGIDAEKKGRNDSGTALWPP